MKRVILIVLDSVGVGELPDAKEFGDEGCNTLGHVAEFMGGLKLPNLEALGLGNIADFKGIKKVDNPKAFYGKMKELSKAKDTSSGHWEIAGVINESSFPVYPDGFPDEIIHTFEKSIGRKILGNYPSSGTEIIQKLGDRHVATGKPIVYTSADSVFQIAAHEEIISVEQLYDICHKARSILHPPHNVCRVIARPFIGKSGNFTRTRKRKDFSVIPPGETVLEMLNKEHIDVVGIGKIGDIFCEKGLTLCHKTRDNKDSVKKIKDFMVKYQKGLIFANLIDFDMIYGHRNDPKGYAASLQQFDSFLPEIIKLMGQEDILMITADHGCDPTMPGTDHSREYVPLLAYVPKVYVPKVDIPKLGVEQTEDRANVYNKNLGIRHTFADIGATIAEIFNIQPTKKGENFLPEWLIRR